MTGPSLLANCADSGNVSSISTNFIISSFLSPADLLKIRTARPHPAAKRLPHRQVVEYVRQQRDAAQDLGQVHLHERSDPKGNKGKHDRPDTALTLHDSGAYVARYS